MRAPLLRPLFLFLLLLGLTAALPASTRSQSFVPPAQPCTNETAFQNGVMVFGREEAGPVIATIERCGARMASIMGAANDIGNDNHPIVNSLVMGARGTVRHSNAALFAFGATYTPGSGAVRTRRNNEIRMHATNGAVFEGTDLTAGDFLAELPDAASRTNVSALATYLAGLSTNATAMVAGLATQHYELTAATSADGRPRMGFAAPTNASAPETVPPELFPPERLFLNETAPAPLLVDQGAGVCQLGISGPVSPAADPIGAGSPTGEPAVLDAVGLLALLAEAVKELDARVTALEP